MHTNYDFKSIKNSIKVAPNQKGKGDRLCCPKPNFKFGSLLPKAIIWQERSIYIRDIQSMNQISPETLIMPLGKLH
jgi:hypothetical protein